MSTLMNTIVSALSGMNNATVTINGKSYSNTQSSYIHSNGDVWINGVKQEQSVVNIVNIEVTGDVGTLNNTNGTVSVTGNVSGGVETTNGKITVGGSVTGDAKTTNGDIRAQSISGKCKTTNGDISR